VIEAQAWTPVEGLTLEPNARNAATRLDQCVVVAAGPGAGKTELLAQRADFLFRTGACRYPRRILAISFKVDAARNLRARVRSRSGAQYAARFDSFTFHGFAKRLVDNYRPALTGSSALPPDYQIDGATSIPGVQITFNDLVPLALEILAANAYARGALRQTYDHVFLDEFQDATDDQYELLKAAFLNTETQLIAVGDVKQRIMAWAGALDGIMQTFAQDFDAVSLPLYQNFRSAPRLRRMQNRMIIEMDPAAASPAEELAGDEGTIEVLRFDNDVDEAYTVSEYLAARLADGAQPSELAILVRQQSRQVTEALVEALHQRGIPSRNEQDSQDLATEPVAALIFNFINVIAADRHPTAYAELMRVAVRTSATEEAAIRFDDRLKRMLRGATATVRDPTFATEDLDAWRPVVAEFLDLLSLPALTALSPAYQQGSRLDEVVEQALIALGNELAVDGDATEALKRLSEHDAVRILTIHKCKSLEFETVVVLGVEEDLFWGDAASEEFFVAISRAKTELLLTWADYRARPSTPVRRWGEHRTPHARFLAYAEDDH
jgi:superfamily I DNA/RNA helicase